MHCVLHCSQCLPFLQRFAERGRLHLRKRKSYMKKELKKEKRKKKKEVGCNRRIGGIAAYEDLYVQSFYRTGMH